jgi:hypothetical protein
MSPSNIANIYQDHSTHLGYPMTKFLCIYDDECCTVGNSIEEAFNTYKSDINDTIDISDLTFYELKNPITARLVLTIDGGS